MGNPRIFSNIYFYQIVVRMRKSYFSSFVFFNGFQNREILSFFFKFVCLLQCCGSGSGIRCLNSWMRIRNLFDLGSGMEKFGSGIRDNHPRSATLVIYSTVGKFHSSSFQICSSGVWIPGSGSVPKR